MTTAALTSNGMRTALLSTAFPVASDGRAQLLPFGRFAARDGRPGPGKTWEVTNDAGEALAADITATAALTPIVIDYDHQTINGPTNGQPAPAAGWVKGATWRNNVGLFAIVEWTAKAKAYIAALEYRFISPVLVYDVAGRVTKVLMASLVNFPALTGMEPAVAALASLGFVVPAPPTATPAASVNELSSRDRAALTAAFGVSPEELRVREAVAKAKLDDAHAGFGGTGMTYNQRDLWLRTFGHSPAQLRAMFP